MRRMLQPLVALVVLSRWALCQPAPAKAEFEAADVHVSAPGTSESGGFLPNGRLEFQGTTLLGLIALAYSLPADRVAGGPPWLDTDRFDVTAQAASHASQIALRNMLQNLLSERFKLA